MPNHKLPPGEAAQRKKERHRQWLANNPEKAAQHAQAKYERHRQAIRTQQNERNQQLAVARYVEMIKQGKALPRNVRHVTRAAIAEALKAPPEQPTEVPKVDLDELRSIASRSRLW